MVRKKNENRSRVFGKETEKKRKTDLGFRKKTETQTGRKRKEWERKRNGSFRKNRTEEEKERRGYLGRRAPGGGG